MFENETGVSLSRFQGGMQLGSMQTRPFGHFDASLGRSVASGDAKNAFENSHTEHCIMFNCLVTIKTTVLLSKICY